ncbi:protein misato [Toxorhynchites rutilus septentrionalis]|uniref:protein misato n=1 Tax=Toxorhynchites rutilus septentrionalis TaxID=329112 RepID=UPI002478B780|nr:protein misato [Toxorhynchites rutilus septentrionalis]XP_055632495.1 protein misato [Toxorhynchites rutilus septentrionalis]XP_055632503.1 protein misato [Toxorhynchites rutilus septentrionalis]
MPREVLTLQLGNYANYVGTHWWNAQEASFNYDPCAEPSEIEHEVLYREGQTLNGQPTFTPRMLLLDLKGTLKFEPKEGELYSFHDKNINEEDVVKGLAWDSSKVEVIKEKPTEKNEYHKDLEDTSEKETYEKDYNFKESVHDWIDFSYSRFHPRSINIINEFTHSKEDIQFDTITNGMEVWRGNYFQDDFTDKIRQYVEECDECQGFQTLFDCNDGFAGIAIKCLEHLQDEYGKASVVFPVIPPRSPNYKNADEVMSSSIRVINTALTFSYLIDNCSLFTPISTMGRCWRYLDNPRCFPNMSYEHTNFYQTSALLATFLDSATLRYRLRSTTVSGSYMNSLCNDLTQYGRKMAAAGLALPFPISNSEDLIDFLDTNEAKFYTQLTPNTTIGNKYVVQSVSVRGIPQTRLKRPPTAKSAQRQQRMAAYRCNSVSEMFQFYYHCQLHASMSHVSACEAPMDIKTPFPAEMFSPRVSFDGFLSDFHTEPKQKILSTPTLAAIQSSGDLADTLESLHREVSRIKIARIPRFIENGLELEDYKENLERLVDFKERYEDNYQL